MFSIIRTLCVFLSVFVCVHRCDAQVEAISPINQNLVLRHANKQPGLQTILTNWMEVGNKSYICWGQGISPYYTFFLSMVLFDKEKNSIWSQSISLPYKSTLLGLRAIRLTNNATRVVYVVYVDEKVHHVYTMLVTPEGKVQHHRLLESTKYTVLPILCLEQSRDDDWYSISYSYGDFDEVVPIRPVCSYAKTIVWVGKESFAKQVYVEDNIVVQGAAGWVDYRGYLIGYHANNPDSTFFWCFSNKGKRLVEEQSLNVLKKKVYPYSTPCPFFPSIVETDKHITVLGYGDFTGIRGGSSSEPAVTVSVHECETGMYEIASFISKTQIDIVNVSNGLHGPGIMKVDIGKEGVKPITIALGCFMIQSPFVIDFTKVFFGKPSENQAPWIHFFNNEERSVSIPYVDPDGVIHEAVVDLLAILTNSDLIEGVSVFFPDEILIYEEEEEGSSKEWLIGIGLFVVLVVFGFLFWYFVYRRSSYLSLKVKSKKQIFKLKDPGPQEQILSRELCEVRMMRASLVDLFDLYYDIERLGLVDELFIRLPEYIHDQTNQDDVRRFYNRLAEEKKPEFVRIVLQHPRCVFGLLAGILTLIQPDEYQEEILACVKQGSRVVE